MKISREMNQSLSNAQCDVASKNKSPSEILRAFNGGWLHNLSVECKRVKETSESSRNDTFLRVKSVWASIPSLASLAVCSSSVPSGPVGILDPVHPSAAWCSSTVTCLGNLAERRPHSPVSLPLLGLHLSVDRLSTSASRGPPRCMF